ncbi:MAG: hypothetical protein AVDCRST_MAG27-4677 [uncultured Craurococcus sp.]|uniref:Uncharacterized protein n=1 Tax=uncultured Craurococcus sp. TaxID=1135998 RepID=A0A6J4JUM1_9PROT|nr:MAG: hypothetical protein AVDCRST_MAG27-4677 [uncultured Craurococcus sp.]
MRLREPSVIPQGAAKRHPQSRWGHAGPAMVRSCDGQPAPRSAGRAVRGP